MPRAFPPLLLLASLLLASLLPACNDETIPALPGTDGGATDLRTNQPDANNNECGPPPASEPGVVMTDRGAVRGAAAGATWAWKGVPYAAPPVGSLRFRPPAKHACFGSTLDTTKFGNLCLQLDEAGNVVGDEDCLTLNVWAPTSPPPAPRPVLVFLPGGGNAAGGSSTMQAGTYIYDAQPLVEATGAVVVTINYRVGVFGFFSLPALDAESDRKVSGNYGLLDQIAALTWVRDNIAGFGGDPGKVLLFGESAGALDTCMLLASPLAKGLFSSALMQSGGCPGPTMAAVQAQDVALLGAAGCDGAADVAACLRAVPGPTLTKALPGTISVSGLDKGTRYGPNVDGYVLPAAPLEMLRKGQHNRVPFVIGANAEETGRAVPAIPNAMAYQNALYVNFGKVLGDAVLAEYPVADYATPRDALVAVTSDARFICPSRQIARAVAGSQSERVYRYFFKHAYDNNPVFKKFGAFHGFELLFVFGHLDAGGYMPSEGEKALSSAIMGYWTRFAGSGDPNGNGATAWPVYDPVTDSHLVLDDTIASGLGVRTRHCDFWDKLSP